MKKIILTLAILLVLGTIFSEKVLSQDNEVKISLIEYNPETILQESRLKIFWKQICIMSTSN